jgi:ABC-type nickel/cobalt efflux system permease component RcnA
MKVVSKWKCKVSICIITYCAKWLLTKHLKEVHGLMAEKVKPERLSTSKRGPQHQNHAKMNTHILGDAMAVQRQNDQKVTSHARAKA